MGTGWNDRGINFKGIPMTKCGKIWTIKSIIIKVIIIYYYP